jgi:predicted transcriptional regulator of viral defense system
MLLTPASRRLQEWDAKGRWVFTRRDLARLFPEDSPQALNKGIARLLDKGLLERVCRGVYINPLARQKDSRLLEHVAVAMRRGEYNYLSLESALSEYGAISQIPLDRLTVMTTGRKGEYRTPYGVIEFTHTARPAQDILAHTVLVPERPLRVATRAKAWRDLKRVGRNLALVDREALSDES